MPILGRDLQPRGITFSGLPVNSREHSQEVDQDPWAMSCHLGGLASHFHSLLLSPADPCRMTPPQRPLLADTSDMDRSTTGLV